MILTVWALMVALGAMVAMNLLQARENRRLSALVRDDLTLFVRYVYGHQIGQAFAADRQRADQERENE